MYKAFKFRLHPNEEQRILINKTFGSQRFVYNYYLSDIKYNDKLIISKTTKLSLKQINEDICK